MRNPFLASLLFLLLLLGCERDIKIDYPEGGGMLCLHSVLQPGDTIRAHLSLTQDFEDPSANPYLRDALITLAENGKPVDTLQLCKAKYRPEEGDSVYIFCSGYPVKVGSTYELRAFKEGFPEVWGSTRLPHKAKIDSVYTHQVKSWTQPYELTIRDAGPEDNFYMLQMLYKDLYKTPAELSTNEPDIGIYGYFGVLKLPNDPVWGYFAFFTDQYFEDNRRKVNFQVQFSTDPSEVNLIVLQSVSEAYFEYVRAISINRALGEHPFSEPVRVPGNIHNGFGLVGSVNRFEVEM